MKSFNNYIVNTCQLIENAKNIKNAIGNKCKLCAVVKANAYGLGLESACKSLKGIADFFACACLKEALSIRVFDKETPILILGHISSEDVDIVADNNISISIGNLTQLHELIRTVKKRINIHLQVNTGLNRYGFRSINEFVKALDVIENNKYINLEGVYTHFATKENDVMFVNKQFLRFLQFKKKVAKKDVIFHSANSYATTIDKYRLDMVRAGYLLYGYMDNKFGNKPVVSITSQIVNILDVKRGDTIGYDRTFKANKSMKIAVIPVGYADGYNRRLSNKFYVLISGKKYRIVGMICMDVFMIDITGCDFKVGQKVTLLGENGGDKIKLSDMASVVDTSPYEIICNFNYKRMNYIQKNK